MIASARRFWVGAVAGSSVLIVFMACGFPDVSYAPEDRAGVPDAQGDVAPGDAAADAPPDELPPDVDPEGGTKDATTVGDAATKIDAAGCVTCDCDTDGFDRLQLDAGCEGGPGAIPDCDDLIKAIHPGQGFVVDFWPDDSSHTPAGDWDCDGQTTKQYPYGSNCAALSSCNDGFVGDPPCGSSTAYQTCKDPLPLLGLTCSLASSEESGSRIQGCH